MLRLSSFRLAAAAIALLAAAPAASARTLQWSGHSWRVRSESLGAPGPNRWSDANVRVQDGALVLAIAPDSSGRWASAEVTNTRHLGYGTYTWVVESDLSALDAHDVLGLFTYGSRSPSHNELDMEASRWGDPAWPSGSLTVWEDAAAGRRDARTFSYSDRPPYTHTLRWQPGQVSFLVTDATGAALAAWTVADGVPVPSDEVPVVNYWRVNGRASAAPSSVRLRSFTFSV